MKTALLIDSTAKTVTEVEVGEGIEDIYKHLGCSCFDIVNLGGGVDCYVDDEGLLKNGYIDEDGTKHNMTGFVFDGGNVLMGNGLIMGHNEEGESVDSPVQVADITAVMTFVEYDRPEDRPQPQMGFMAW
jgi:hypothetical protein